MSTQLSEASGYKTNRMVFSKPQSCSIPNSSISYKRINIGTMNNDGSQGDLIIATSSIFSFGVQENKDLNTQKVNGYVMPLCLHNRNGVTDEETEFTDVFNKIVEHCKSHVMKNKDAIEKYDLEEGDLKKFNPLYYKRDKGKIVEGVGPMLYAKLLFSNKQKKISSMFTEIDTGEDIDPFSLKNRYCYVTAAIKVEIYLYR